jgi:hypothetical protein
MERICKKCKYFVVTGTSFDKRNKHFQDIGVCHKPGRRTKRIGDKPIRSELMWDNETCKAFKKRVEASSKHVNKK